MDSAALASRALQPPRCRRRRSPPARARPGIPAARMARASLSWRCQAVAADERSADPSIPEGQNRAISGALERPEADVVVIGSGLGGLCCAGLLARYGQDVLVLESHDRPGGAAHSFDVKGFNFDSGPSLFSGFQSRGPQANPLAQVLDALGESVPCASYDSWMVYVPEGEFLSRIGPTDFLKDLDTFIGAEAVQEWKKLLLQWLCLHCPFVVIWVFSPQLLVDMLLPC